MPNNDPKKWSFFVSEIHSENIAETPDGFLVCKNVPVARTGEYIYAKGEVPVSDKDGIVKILRNEEVVFDEDTIKSFEGKPITLDHPDEFVTPENWNELAHGHLQNVRRGDGEKSDLLLADLLITTSKAIELVKGGLRQVSLGYDSDYEELETGVGRQKDIIGNHLALVDKGRAGNRCAIGDKMCDHCGKCKCKNNKEEEVMGDMKKVTFRTKVKDAFKKVLDALENELTDLSEEDEKKKEEDSKTGDDKSFNKKVVKSFNKRAGLDAEVKQQSDVGSNQWGIYVDGKLVEGGFFSKSAAEKASVQYSKDEAYDPLDAEGKEQKEDVISSLRAKVEELSNLLDQASNDSDRNSKGNPVEKTEDPDILKARQKAAEEKQGVTDEEEGVGSETETEEGDIKQTLSEILSRLDKLEEVIVELVQSDEEVHAAMDSIMNGEKKDGTVLETEEENKEEATSDQETDLEKKDDDENKELLEEKKGTMDSGVWTEVAYRVGILAPDMNIAKPDKHVPQVVDTIKREALKRAMTTDAECVAPFVRNKNLNTLSGEALDTAFVGASELIAKINNGRVQSKSLHKTYDAGSPVANQIHAINERNKNFWKR